MIYIKSTKDYEEVYMENKIPKLIKKIFFDIKSMTGDFFIKKVSNGEMIILPNTNKKTKKKLLNFLKIYNIKTLCISKELEEKHFFDGDNLNILRGKWLYKYLILNYIKYIFVSQEKNPKEQEISFLINKITELDLDNIEKVALYVKNVNVVTDSISRIRKLADKLYKEKGIILNITKNYKKSLIKSSIIINIDFTEEELNKFVFPRRTIILNIGNRIKINYKGFEGVNIFDYNVSVPEKILTQELSLADFRKEILYESYLYKNTSPNNIFREIERDNITIESLVGQKGILRKQEFSK